MIKTPIKQENQDVDFLLKAARLASASPCLRRKFGCIITGDRGGYFQYPIGIGFNAPPQEAGKCETCLRDEYRIPPSLHTEMCRAVHAEQNAILDALYRHNGYLKNEGCLTLYIVEGDKDGNLIPATWIFRCTLCSRMILQAGIHFVVRAVKIPKSKEHPDEWKPVRCPAWEAFEDSYKFVLDIYKAHLEGG